MERAFFLEGRIKVRSFGHHLSYDSFILRIVEGTYMQTMYYPISDHVQPAGEVVDLEELRRRRAQAQPPGARS